MDGWQTRNRPCTVSIDRVLMTDFLISREIGTGSWCEYLSWDHLKILWRTLAPESFKNHPLYSKKKANGNSPIVRWWYSEILRNQIFFFVFFHNKITSLIFDGTFRKNSSFFFFGILISKQIALASLFSFPLRIKTSFRKNITDDSVFFLRVVECIGNTQIIHMEETGITQQTIGLMTD